MAVVLNPEQILKSRSKSVFAWQFFEHYPEVLLKTTAPIFFVFPYIQNSLSTILLRINTIKLRRNNIVKQYVLKVRYGFFVLIHL